MKNVFIVLLFLSSGMIIGQAPGFGIKGGLNYGTVGDLELTSEFVRETFSKENRAGYHAGIFYKINLGGLFIQPELLYTELNTEFTGTTTSAGTNVLNYEFSKIDVPILVGLDILGPLNIQAGPSFQYILDSGFEDINIDFEDPQNSFTVGYQLGAGITLGQLALGVRYEGAFQDNTIVSKTDVEDIGFRVDSRPSQWILSLSYSFNRK